MFFPQRFPLIGLDIEELTRNFVELITGSDEFTLDRISFAIECLLDLLQAEAECYAIPSLALFVQIIDLKVTCSLFLFCLPRRV